MTTTSKANKWIVGFLIGTFVLLLLWFIGYLHNRASQTVNITGVYVAVLVLHCITIFLWFYLPHFDSTKRGVPLLPATEVAGKWFLTIICLFGGIVLGILAATVSLFNEKESYNIFLRTVPTIGILFGIYFLALVIYNVVLCKDFLIGLIRTLIFAVLSVGFLSTGFVLGALLIMILALIICITIMKTAFSSNKETEEQRSRRELRESVDSLNSTLRDIFV